MLMPKRTKYRRPHRLSYEGRSKAGRSVDFGEFGSGKGAPEGWVAVVKPGRVMFEIGGVSEEVAREALRLASHKLPVKTRFVRKGEVE
ncbi:ribosomal protein L16 [uncultured Dubosiella sp.]|uniref:large ribosomal subunit protein uL16 n=1 Tax=uncultured Dubosiella sp. TaxID=1937011 RepID=UPI0027314F68|nr:ribosomal protein L16 [uncultured Dubosiella sp.]